MDETTNPNPGPQGAGSYSSSAHQQASEHFRQAGVEVLKGVRQLLDTIIEDLSSHPRRPGQHQTPC